MHHALTASRCGSVLQHSTWCALSETPVMTGVGSLAVRALQMAQQRGLYLPFHVHARVHLKDRPDRQPCCGTISAHAEAVSVCVSGNISSDLYVKLTSSLSSLICIYLFVCLFICVGRAIPRKTKCLWHFQEGSPVN